MRYGLGAKCFLDLFITCVLVVFLPMPVTEHGRPRDHHPIWFWPGSVWVCLKMGYTGIPSKYPFHAGKMIMNRLTIKFRGSLFSDKPVQLCPVRKAQGTWHTHGISWHLPRWRQAIMKRITTILIKNMEDWLAHGKKKKYLLHDPQASTHYFWAG